MIQESRAVVDTGMTHRISLVLSAGALTLAVAACGGSGSTSPAAHTSSAATSASSSAGGGSSAPAGSGSSAPVSGSSAPAGGSASATSSSATASSAPRSGHVTVTIRNYMYEPMHLTVTAGTTVSFHNDDAAPHTATALNGGFDTGTIKQGQTRTVTLKKSGHYAYHCLFHAFMTASITVVAKS
jgi:plastocyanin